MRRRLTISVALRCVSKHRKSAIADLRTQYRRSRVNPRSGGRPHPSRHSLSSFLRMRARSLPLHLGVVDDLAPLRLVGLDVFRELLGRARDRFEILPLKEILLDVGIGEDLAHL